MHDQSYKLLFSHARMVEDLLRGFVPDSWVGELDFTTLERLNASYVSDDLRERHDDVIWRVRFRETWLYLYLLLEFQSTEDTFMAVRIPAYTSLLYQDLLRSNRLSANGKLPPVLAIVLYNGQTRWRAAAQLNELIEPAPEALQGY
jgi:predicted transposase YdaD